MMLAMALAACTATEGVEDTSDPGAAGETADTASAECDWDSISPVPLAAWDSELSTGFTAADAFAFAVGDHESALYWDDGTSTTLWATVTPVAATEYVWSEPELCPASQFALDVEVSLETADARLDLVLAITWYVEEAEPGQDLGGAVVQGVVDAAESGTEPLDADSRFDLTALFDSDGPFYFGLWERWEVDAVTTRVCKRASTDTDLDCYDSEDEEDR